MIYLPYGQGVITKILVVHVNVAHVPPATADKLMEETRNDMMPLLERLPMDIAAVFVPGQQFSMELTTLFDCPVVDHG